LEEEVFRELDRNLAAAYMCLQNVRRVRMRAIRPPNTDLIPAPNRAVMVTDVDATETAENGESNRKGIGETCLR